MSQPDLDGFERSLRAAYGVFEIEPIAAPSQSSGAMIPLTLGPFSGFEIDAQSVRSARPSLGDMWADHAFILLPMAGDVTVHHYDRVAPLAAGDLILMDSRAPCVIDVESSTRSVVLGTSRDMLSQLRPNAEHLYALPINGQFGMGRLLSTMLCSLDAAPHAGSSARDAAAIVSVMLTLLDRSLGACAGEGSEKTARAHKEIEAMREWAEAHLGDPELDAVMLADRFGLSRRSLYRLFAEAGTTPQRWLSNLRLDLAQRWLNDRSGPRRSVSQVAFAAGFNDSSHFARLFRKRFGASPTALRH